MGMASGYISTVFASTTLTLIPAAKTGSNLSGADCRDCGAAFGAWISMNARDRKSVV